MPNHISVKPNLKIKLNLHKIWARYILWKKLYLIVIFSFQFNPIYQVVVSVDKAGILEYWSGYKQEFKFPKCVHFESKLDTDLFEFAKNKTYPSGLSFSPDGNKFVTISMDRKVKFWIYWKGASTL